MAEDQEASWPDGQLFPVSKLTKNGTERKTAKMMRRDLAVARKKWIEEAKTTKEHSCGRSPTSWRTRIRPGVMPTSTRTGTRSSPAWSGRASRPRTAQTLARHSDIRLTMGIYTHIGLDVQTSAIGSLPAPPKEKSSKPEGGPSEAA